MELHQKLSEGEFSVGEPCALKLLKETCELDEKLQGTEHEIPLPIVGSLFAHYQYSVKKLDKIYDEDIQPQKGMWIKKLLEAANRRLMELKNALVQIDISEYHYVDGNIVQLKLIPNDFEIFHLEALPTKRNLKMQTNIDRLLLKGN